MRDIRRPVIVNYSLSNGPLEPGVHAQAYFAKRAPSQTTAFQKLIFIRRRVFHDHSCVISWIRPWGSS